MEPPKNNNDKDNEDEYEELKKEQRIKGRGPLAKENEALVKEIIHVKTKLHILEITEAEQLIKMMKEIRQMTTTIDCLQEEATTCQNEIVQLRIKLLGVNWVNRQTSKLESEIVHVKQVKESAEREMETTIVEMLSDAKNYSKAIISRAEVEAYQIIEQANLKAAKKISKTSSE